MCLAGIEVIQFYDVFMVSQREDLDFTNEVIFDLSCMRDGDCLFS